ERPGRFGYSAMIASAWIDGAAELATLLELTPSSERPQILREVGAEIGRMHEAGIAHPDLNLRNLLVAPGVTSAEPLVVIIDFDLAWVRSKPVPGWRRRADMRRFVRSTWRLGAPMGEPEFAALRAGYGSAWPLPAGLG